MLRKNRLLTVTGVVLVMLMIFGIGAGLVKTEKEIPDNPINTKAQYLNAETVLGSGKLAGTAEKSDKSEGVGSEAETQTMEQPQEEEPQEQQEETKESEVGSEDETLPPEESEKTQEGSGGDNSSGGGEGEGGNGDGGEGEEDGSPQIATDLRTCQITLSELPDGILKFYAYPVGKGEDLSVKVVLNNSKTPKNGKVLSSQDGINYKANLAVNEANTITLYLKEKGENIAYARYVISYESDKADEENPEVGDYPPTITTNLDGFTGDMKTQDFVLWVKATANPKGETIYSNRIEVWLDGKLVKKSTGDSRPEYDLHFEPPNKGDKREYKVKVRAWDGKGNSTMKTYTINYFSISEGDVNGKVTVIIDATTVGLGGELDREELEIRQGENAASVVLRFLETCSYEADYSGSVATGCYLRRLERGDMCRNAKVPDKLWELIKRDGIVINNNKDRDSLGEFDYTMGSGWMYSINGQVYAGRGLSNQTVSDGDKIYIRFTLAYGKDVGGTGDGKGKLGGYCGAWINGAYQPVDHGAYFTETSRQDSTYEAEGYIEYTCSMCGETKKDIIPIKVKDENEPENPDDSGNTDVTPDNPDNPGNTPTDPGGSDNTGGEGEDSGNTGGTQPDTGGSGGTETDTGGTGAEGGGENAA